ncbi:MAG TPA: alpha/beta fold hydrolase [Chryseolinea sp.]|nr:alpha/beta fold hydrolase [Chryseolinea sp.]
MYSRAIHLNNAVLSYDVHGHGSRALLMFHGAGQDRSIFHRLPSGLTSHYRVYAFDLFFHGESQWNNPAPVSKNDWRILVEEFCAIEQVEKISVLGYSIGARFALATLEALPHKMQACFLVAPDGLSPNRWFSIATGSGMGRNVFRNCMHHPARLERMIGLARRLGLVNSSTLRFLEHQLDSEAKRLRIYRTWTSLRLFRFDRSALHRIIESGRIRLFVYLAAQDQMIAAAPIRVFLKRLKSAHLEVIDLNHRRVLTEALERIATL